MCNLTSRWQARRGESAAREPNPRRRLALVLRTLWRDLPAESNGFANNIMHTVSGTTSGEGYRPTLLQWAETRMAAIIRDAVPAGRRRLLGPGRFSHILMMAFDGFVINHHLNPRAPCGDDTIEAMVSLLLGPRLPRRRPKAR